MSTFFTQHTISDLSFDKKTLYSLKDTDNVETALALLNDKKIQSAPVFKGDAYVGTVSVFDIMMYIAFGPVFKDEIKAEQLSSLALKPVPIVDLIGLAEEGKTAWVYTPSEPLGKLLDPFSLGVHRVLVREHDDSGKAVFRSLSQTDFLRLVVKNSDALKDVLSKNILNEGLANPAGGKLVVLPHTESALRGFQLLVQHDVNAVPVVDDNGKLVGTLSASDCRGLRTGNLPSVLLPVLEFLKSHHGQLSVPVTCNERSTLGDAALLMSAAGVHRVWAVDSAQKPIGVVTQSDVIRAFRNV